jgi:hypothetical protein
VIVVAVVWCYALRRVWTAELTHRVTYSDLTQSAESIARHSTRLILSHASRERLSRRKVCMRSARLSSVSLDGVYEFAINSACMANEVPQNEVASSFIIHVRQDYNFAGWLAGVHS